MCTCMSVLVDHASVACAQPVCLALPIIPGLYCDLVASQAAQCNVHLGAMDELFFNKRAMWEWACEFTVCAAVEAVAAYPGRD